MRLNSILFIIALTLVTTAVNAANLDWMAFESNELINNPYSPGYSTNIGSIRVDSGVGVCPVKMIFNPYEFPISGIFGCGWRLPLVEAYAVLEKENLLRVLLPNGEIIRFKRNGSDFHDNGGWSVKMSGSDLTLLADSGDQVKYRKGRVVEFTKGKRLSFSIRYLNSKPESLKLNGSNVLLIMYSGELADGLKIDGVSRKVSYSEFALTEKVEGKVLIKGFRPAIDKLTSEKNNLRYRYHIDSDLSRSLIKILADKREVIIWKDAREQQTYPHGSNSRIQYDSKPGQIVSFLEGNGKQSVEHYFLSGALTGRLRKVELIGSGGSEVVYRSVFNEDGKLLRDYIGNDILRNIEQGRVDVIKDGKLIYRYKVVDGMFCVEEQEE